MQPKPEYPLQLFLLNSELCLKSFLLNMMQTVTKWYSYMQMGNYFFEEDLKSEDLVKRGR